MNRTHSMALLVIVASTLVFCVEAMDEHTFEAIWGVVGGVSGLILLCICAIPARCAYKRYQAPPTPIVVSPISASQFNAQTPLMHAQPISHSYSDTGASASHVIYLPPTSADAPVALDQDFDSSAPLAHPYAVVHASEDDQYNDPRYNQGVEHLESDKSSVTLPSTLMYFAYCQEEVDSFEAIEAGQSTFLVSPNLTAPVCACMDIPLRISHRIVSNGSQASKLRTCRGGQQVRAYVLSANPSEVSEGDAQMITKVPTLQETFVNPKYGYPDPKTFPSSVSTPYFKFEVLYESKKSRARVGRIHTPHGSFETPSFVPVATNGALKYVDIGTTAAESLDTQLIFSNTYHLLIHPGADAIELAGGIHRFCGYNRPMITDSGGFQVFSMANTTSQDELKGKIARVVKSTGKSAPNLLKKVNEQGALFRSYRDGKLIELTPQSSVQAQKKIGADIIIPLDILLPNAVSRRKLLEAFHRTHRWEAASLREHLRNLNQQAMYAVIHGGTNLELRRLSLQYLSSLPFQGMAIGGSLGKNSSEMYSLLKQLCPSIPSHFPIHLLGIGDPPSVRFGASLGIDTFDSAYPTKTGRHGQFFAYSTAPDDVDEFGMPRIVHMDITKPRFQDIHNKPPVEGCQCPTCTKHTAAYVHHLFTMNEPIALTMGAMHNIHFMMNMMKTIRQRILDGKM